MMIKAVRTSETSVDNHFTRQYIPEDNSEHHTRRRENLKSQINNLVSFAAYISEQFTLTRKINSLIFYMSIPVAARSKAYVCGRLVAGIAGLNSARGMDVCHLCLYVVLSCIGTGLCDGLIPRPGESYHVSNCMCDHRNPERGPMSQWELKRK
jgi:hypothetical protein